MILNTVYYYSKPIKKTKKNNNQQTNKNQQLFSYNLVADQIRQQLAAVLERCNQIEKDATDKAEARHREQERKLRGQLIESQKLRMEAEKAKKAAQESYAAAEAARIMADEERQQLLADRSNTTKDLLKELRRHTKYSDDSSDDDGDSRRPAKKKKKSEQSELFTLDGELKVPAPYEGMDMSNLVMHSQIHNEIVNHIANNEFFDLQEMFSGEELTTAGSWYQSQNNKTNHKKVGDILSAVHFRHVLSTKVPAKGSRFPRVSRLSHQIWCTFQRTRTAEARLGPQGPLH